MIQSCHQHELLHLRIDLSLYVFPKEEPQELVGPKDYCLEQVWTSQHGHIPQEQAPRFPHGWLNESGSPNTPTMIGWIIGNRLHQKSSARKVTHLSTIPALGTFASEFPRIQV